jgi:excisionase family DNA binding protein
MNPQHEARIRAACAALADALVEAAQSDDRHPVDVERLLSIPEACEAIGIGRSRIYHELDSGRLRSIKVGRRRLVPASAVAEFAR